MSETYQDDHHKPINRVCAFQFSIPINTRIRGGVRGLRFELAWAYHNHETMDLVRILSAAYGTRTALHVRLRLVNGEG
jgi:hypothetical protein